MITCPNCNHQNPDGALQCEACYTPLPAMAACPNCHAPVQSDASFCGQCGYDLRGGAAVNVAAPEVSPLSSSSGSSLGSSLGVSSAEVSASPDSTIKTQNFLVENEPMVPTSRASASSELASGESTANLASTSDFELPDLPDLPDLVEPDPLIVPKPIGNDPAEIGEPTTPSNHQPLAAAPETESAQAAVPAAPVQAFSPSPPANATQLQTLSARLRQVQTNTVIEIPRQLSVVRIGKPNDQTPPDIDVSGFPDSEVVSRVHANLRVEGDVYYIEDVGSSNGTYINGLPLAAGNRHRLRPGDRIALGKGDKVSFTFETT